jgi:hypothetical protein
MTFPRIKNYVFSRAQQKEQINSKFYMNNNAVRICYRYTLTEHFKFRSIRSYVQFRTQNTQHTKGTSGQTNTGGPTASTRIFEYY